MATRRKLGPAFARPSTRGCAAAKSCGSRRSSGTRTTPRRTCGRRWSTACTIWASNISILYLIHFPISLRFVPFHMRYPPGWIFDPDAATPRMEPTHVPIAETWAAMEELGHRGAGAEYRRLQFWVRLLRDLRTYANIRPAVLQVELHPFLAQEKLLRFCRESHIAVTGFSPLGAQSYHAIGMAEATESVLRAARRQGHLGQAPQNPGAGSAAVGRAAGYGGGSQNDKSRTAR